MRKIIALLLSVILLLSLCACKDSGRKLARSDIESVLQDTDGELVVKGKDDNVKSFTYSVKDVSAEHLSDSDFLYDAITQVATDASSASLNQLEAFSVFPAVVKICWILAGKDAQTSMKELWDTTESVVCLGKTVDYYGWKISAKINENNDSIVFKVKK